jgi:hypothetical protein
MLYDTTKKGLILFFLFVVSYDTLHLFDGVNRPLSCVRRCPFQSYKKAFVDEKLWAVLSDNLGKLLRKEQDERSEDDRMTIERILILVRNILQVTYLSLLVASGFLVAILPHHHGTDSRRDSARNSNAEK